MRIRDKMCLAFLCVSLLAPFVVSAKESGAASQFVGPLREDTGESAADFIGPPARDSEEQDAEFVGPQQEASESASAKSETEESETSQSASARLTTESITQSSTALQEQSTETTTESETAKATAKTETQTAATTAKTETQTAATTAKTEPETAATTAAAETQTTETTAASEAETTETTAAETQTTETTAVSAKVSAQIALEEMITPVDDTVIAAEDSDVLDYPGKKDGTVIGEVLEHDELTRTGTIDNTWSQVIFTDDDGEEQAGYILSSVLEGYEAETLTADGSDGSLHAGSGEGVFSDALDGVTSVNGSGEAAEGVVVGTPVSASADAYLVELGVFKITHYCPCSICCGPYANGITATGVTAVTNHTIAVDPTVIPYGSKVVINGQIYVAEDCGGAIKGNRIDIYVGSHAEGEELGTYNTEVYLLQED